MNGIVHRQAEHDRDCQGRGVAQFDTRKPHHPDHHDQGEQVGQQSAQGQPRAAQSNGKYQQYQGETDPEAMQEMFDKLVVDLLPEVSLAGKYGRIFGPQPGGIFFAYGFKQGHGISGIDIGHAEAQAHDVILFVHPVTDLFRNKQESGGHEHERILGRYVFEQGVQLSEQIGGRGDGKYAGQLAQVGCKGFHLTHPLGGIGGDGGPGWRRDEQVERDGATEPFLQQVIGLPDRVIG